MAAFRELYRRAAAGAGKAAAFCFGDSPRCCLCMLLCPRIETDSRIVRRHGRAAVAACICLTDYVKVFRRAAARWTFDSERIKVLLFHASAPSNRHTNVHSHALTPNVSYATPDVNANAEGVETPPAEACSAFSLTWSDGGAICMLNRSICFFRFGSWPY